MTLKRAYWPTEGWRAADPEAVGMRAELLTNLDREIAVRFRSVNACLVIRRGYLAFEQYYNGFSQGDPHLVASVTKSFVSALIGIAIEKGFIEGVQQPVLDFFPEYVPGPREHLKRQMTIEHLLTMTSGFQWRSGARNSEYMIGRLRRSKNWTAFILDLPVRERWFGRFQYNSGCSHLLSAIITRSTGKSAAAFAAEHLFSPIGMELPAADMQQGQGQDEVFRNKAGVWPTDPQGNSIGGWGLFLKARDMARFGYLYISGGLWDGQPIIPSWWIEDSVRPYTPGYGYQWWVRDAGGVIVYSAVGRGGQHIFCVPERELVVVVASKLEGRWRDRWRLLERSIIPAAA